MRNTELQNNGIADYLVTTSMCLYGFSCDVPVYMACYSHGLHRFITCGEGKTV